jgi:gamma-glutamylcyclotransferase (GGCT)/AIG2-like uncharacterized protein YtfP
MKYFAYGSNMDPKRVKERRIRFSKREHAVLEGFKLEFNKVSALNPKEGYANIVEDKNEIVEGILYEIEDEDINKLDKFEGVPRHYRRINLRVKLDSQEIVEATTYIAQTDMTRQGLKPTKQYLNHLLQGCDLLSQEYCDKLKKMETLD